MSDNFFKTMHLNFSSHKFGQASEQLRENVFEFQRWSLLDISWIKFNQMQLNYGWNKIWEILRKYSRRHNWTPTQTRFQIVLRYFRQDPFDFQLRHSLDISWTNFRKVHFSFGWRTFWNCLRSVGKVSKWILAKTQLGKF